MIITVYNVKGSAGKTPISTNIVLDRDYAIGTNEPFHILDTFIPDERLLSIQPDENFPEIPEGIDIVFDLAGSISSTSISISSALKQSDLVIVPIYNEIKCLQAGLQTILEVLKYTSNIVVVATKLQKQKGETFGKNWNESADFLNIKNAVEQKINIEKPIPVLPLKFSKVFDSIFEKELSITQLMDNDALLKHAFKDVNKQFNDLYKVIDNYA